MRLRATVLLLSCVAVTFDVGAQPVKCVDASGRVRYIDASMAGQEKCTPVRAEMQVVPGQPGAAAPAPSRGNNPVEREGRLVQAENRLAAAKKALADQEAVREGGERNYARVEERLAPFRAAVESAEADVEQARRALR